jgi:hypothetical protein
VSLETQPGAIERIEVGSLGEMLDQATPETADPRSGRLRDSVVYRGSADLEWSLLTSLDRLGGIDPPHTKAALEEHILRNFLRYSRPYLDRPIHSHWEALVIAQHHGLPTRLLDWTYSPLVAAHFATLEESPAPNRVVWKLDWKQLHERFSLRRVAFQVDDLDAVLQARKIHSIWQFFAESEGLEESFACMMEPPSLDLRIVAQAATFTVCSSKEKSLDLFLTECGLASALTKFVIPGDCVDHVRDQLDLCAVDERRLFPDLGGVTRQMRRYYSMSPVEGRGGRSARR